MKLNNLIFTALAGFSIILTGCQNNDENEQHYDNKLFISASNFTKEILFKAGDTNVETGLSVAIAKPEKHDIKVTMSPAPELLSTYKQAYYDETAVLLSEEHYSMPETSTTIKSGSIVSPELPIEFINTGELDIKTTYVLPVTIKSVEGIGVLQSAKTYYYVFRGASLINVVCNISRNRAYPDFKNDSKFNNLTENTMEILFKANSFPNTLNTLMGIESNYLLRIGDANIPNNQLQVATSVNNCTSADLQLESGKWYHVAAVWSGKSWDIFIDGVYVTGVATQGETINLSSDNSGGFYLGASYGGGRPLNGYVAECRVWTRALTEAEISNNMNYVNPESDGLLAYWRMNAWEAKDGGGNIVKDLTGHGYDAVGGSSNPTMMDTKWM